MKITLIQCPAWVIESPPYNIALIAAALKNRRHDPVCLDLNIELYNYCKDKVEANNWLSNEKGSCWYDRRYVLTLFEKFRRYIDELVCRVLDIESTIVGFTIYGISQTFSEEFARRLKEKDPSKIIIFGGPRCFRNYQGQDILEKSPWVDAVCFGEAEECLPNLLEILEEKGKISSCEGFAYRDTSGKLIDCGDYPLIDDLDKLPFADFSYFDLEKYTKQILPIATSRGCIRRCTFCNESTHWKKYRFRNANNIYSEITHQLNKHPAIREFWFNDSLINGNIKELDELSNLIIKNDLHISWGGQAVIREEMTREFLNKLRQAGCSNLSYGLESGSDKILELMNKNYNTKIAQQVIHDTYESGIGSSFNIIVGFPGETELEFQETANFIKRNIAYTTFIPLNPLYVQAGSELYKNREKWGIEFIQDLNPDLFWRTVDKTNNYEERLRRLSTCKKLIGNKAATDVDKFYVNKKFFRWYLHYTCNFRCPYCWFYKGWAEAGRRNIYLSPQEWMVHWQRVYDKYGSIRIEITGGEPFIYPHFTELIKELSRMHSVGITTNLSVEVEDFIKEMDTSKVKVTPTFHPLFADFDKFSRKMLLLKESGIGSHIFYLAYPPQIKFIKYYSDKFSNLGMPMEVLTFWGQYNGKSYPQSYTQEEKELIEPYLSCREEEKFQLEAKQVKGKLCRAGQVYANIKADGLAFRCGGNDGEPIGNLFNNNFKLLDEPSPCKSEFCLCNEWASLLIEEKAPVVAEKDKIALTKSALRSTEDKSPKYPRKDPPYRVYWNWDIGYECNYQCSYCVLRKREERYPYVEIDRWKKIWDSIFEKYWCCHIRFSGGEPFVYPHFIELIGMLSEKHTVDVTTNLSFDLDPFLKKISPGGVTLSASFHSEFVGIDEFLDKIVFLTEKGFPTSIAFVAYPPHLKDLERYKKAAGERKIFSQTGILFKVIPFIGEFEGKKYPESYSPQQKKLLEEAATNTEIESQKELNVQWLDQGDSEKSRLDKYCRMGQMYAKILPNGDVTRCCHADYGKMGSIFDEDFRLLDEPAPCRIQSCLCWKPMIVGYKEDKYPIFWEMPEHKIYKLNKL